MYIVLSTLNRLISSFKHCVTLSCSENICLEADIRQSVFKLPDDVQIVDGSRYLMNNGKCLGIDIESYGFTPLEDVLIKTIKFT